MLLVGQGLRSWGRILLLLVLLVVEVAHNRIVAVLQIVVLGVFIWKKPIVTKIQAMNIKMPPITIIDNIAPYHSSMPAVSNDFSPVFCASEFSVIFRRLAAMT